MPEVVLTRVAFIPSRDLDELEKKVTDLLKDFEKKQRDRCLRRNRNS